MCLLPGPPSDGTVVMNKLDAEVLALLEKCGRLWFYEIDTAVRAGPFELNGFRKTDRSLQRLRRLGYIEFDSKRGWGFVD